MRHHPETIARIKACRGLYSTGDTAKFFGVSKSLVHDVWTGSRHGSVEASEAPNIRSTRIAPDLLIDEAQTLLERGMKVPEVADELGVHGTTVYRHMKKQGRYVGLVFG